MRCWVRREEGPHVVAWYLLDDGEWVFLSNTCGLVRQNNGKSYNASLLNDLETMDEWEEVPFASLQP